MTRRTITFSEGIEDGVREAQIEMMRSFKRDVPFTEAVNWIIFRGLYANAEAKGIPDKELTRQIAHWADGLDKINIESILDSIPTTHDADGPRS